MPVTIQFTDDGLGVILTGSTVVTGEELIAAIQAVYADERYPSVKYWIGDHSDCDQFLVKTEHLQHIASLNKIEGVRNQGILLTLVASRDHAFAVSRQFEMLDDGSGFITHVFRNRAMADQWLTEQLGQSLTT